MLSRLISKQKHYNFLHEYGVNRGILQYDVFQLRNTPTGWMRRNIRVRRTCNTVGRWYKIYGADPTRAYTTNYGNYYIELSLCQLKRRLKKDGLSYH